MSEKKKGQALTLSLGAPCASTPGVAPWGVSGSR